MTSKICSHAKIFPLLIFVLFFLFIIHTPAFSYPIKFTDAQGNLISIKERPLRVVSLVPSITEILFKIGAGDAVKGTTYHSIYLPETSKKEIIGGFSSPSLTRIEEMNPDVIFYSHSHKMVTERFGNKEKQILKEEIFKSRRLDIDLDYIAQARIAYSHIHDFINKTLIIDFKKPLSIVSTLEGQREGIESVGNHYSPPPCWSIGHKQGLKDVRTRVFQVIGKSADTASILFTGADMDNLSVKHQRYKDMAVYALVTAGVMSNALRTSKDVGNYYEPGTINIILLPNMNLTPRAMTRAIITATEAKTAALLDMDIRSSYSPRFHRATGTGTDNIIAVQGTGIRIDNSGGHTKMGELI